MLQSERLWGRDRLGGLRALQQALRPAQVGGRLTALTLEPARHPEQWQSVSDGRADVGLATEEALRWAVLGNVSRRESGDRRRLAVPHGTAQTTEYEPSRAARPCSALTRFASPASTNRRSCRGLDTFPNTAQSSPGMHVMRTATEPTRLGDVQIEAGQRVVTWIGSANRDESVFDRPDEFDVCRADNKQLSFGAGRHLCLGNRVARLEISAYLKVPRTCVGQLSLIGEPRYNGSNFIWGINRLPLRLESQRSR